MIGFFVDSIQRKRAPLGVDARGNEIRRWDQAALTTIGELSVQPNSQTEQANALRDLRITSWRVQSAPGVDLDIEATDRVIWAGDEYEVDGEVARWSDPIFGGVHHVEFLIRLWEG